MDTPVTEKKKVLDAFKMDAELPNIELWPNRATTELRKLIIKHNQLIEFLKKEADVHLS
jgi:hypothetical protein